MTIITNYIRKRVIIMSAHVYTIEELENRSSSISNYQASENDIISAPVESYSFSEVAVINNLLHLQPLKNLLVN